MVSSGEDQLLLFRTGKKKKNLDHFFFSKRIFSELIFVSLLEWIVIDYINLPGLIHSTTFSCHQFNSE